MKKLIQKLIERLIFGRQLTIDERKRVDFHRKVSTLQRELRKRGIRE